MRVRFDGIINWAQLGSIVRSVLILQLLFANSFARADEPAANPQAEDAATARTIPVDITEEARVLLRRKVELDKTLAELNHEIANSSAEKKEQSDFETLLSKRRQLEEETKSIEEKVFALTGYSAMTLSAVGANGKSAYIPVIMSARKRAAAERQQDEWLEHAWNSNHPITGAVKNFSTQWVTFNMATGLIAASQLIYANPGDPNWFENWQKQTLSVMGAAGFAVFWAGQSTTNMLLTKAASGIIPPALIPFIGMGAGVLLQSAFSALISDKDMLACFAPWSQKLDKSDPEACSRARTTWLDSGNILNFAPQTFGMLFSSGIAAAIEQQLFGRKAFRGYVRVVNSGLGVAPKSEWVSNAAKFTRRIPLRIADFGALKVPLLGRVFGGGLTNLVLFLVVDTDIVEPAVNQAWQDLNANWFDPSSYIKKSWGLHSEFFSPRAYQPIQNVFDVEANTPYSAHLALIEEYRKLQANGWKEPAPVSSCVPEKIAEEIKKNPDDLKKVQNEWFWNRWATETSRKKSEAQLTCEMLAQPEKLLESYAKTNHGWRDILLSRFNASQSNWTSAINEFSNAYGASLNLAGFLAKSKNAQMTKGAAAPDLKREALAKVVQTRDDANTNNWFLDGTWIPTPTMLDYVAAGSACGSDPVLNSGGDEGGYLSRAVDHVIGGIFTFAGRHLSSPNFIATPYGSSLRFVPPKLTSTGRDICNNVREDAYGTVNYMLGGWLPKKGERVDSNRDPFTGPFRAENGKDYPSLVAYAYENLDPAIYQTESYGTSFGKWWDTHFTDVISPVWSRYDVTYRSFLDDQYLPVLWDRSFRYGCKNTSKAFLTTKPVDDTGLLKPTTATSAATASKGEDVACQDDSNAYHVANGIFLAMETEARNYVRGLYSLYATLLTNSDAKPDAVAKGKHDFMQLANDMLLKIRANRVDDLQVPILTDRLNGAEDDLNKLVAMVESSLKTAPDSPDGKFRLAMSKALSKNIEGVLKEQEGYAQTIHLVDHAKSTERVYMPIMTSKSQAKVVETATTVPEEAANPLGAQDASADDDVPLGGEGSPN